MDELQAERVERADEVKAIRAESQHKIINAEQKFSEMLKDRYAKGLRDMRDFVLISYPDVEPNKVTPEALSAGPVLPGFPPHQAPADQ